MADTAARRRAVIGLNGCVAGWLWAMTCLLAPALAQSQATSGSLNSVAVSTELKTVKLYGAGGWLG